ncbi:MAG: OmpA family protein [Pseudomonadota bacterium]
MSALKKILKHLELRDNNRSRLQSGLISGCFLLILLFVVFWVVERPQIESQLAQNVRSLLQQRDYADVEVTFAGRDGVLTGSVPSRTAKEYIFRWSGDVEGVRKITDQTTIVAKHLPFFSLQTSSRNEVVVTGESPDTDEVDRWLLAVKTAFPDVPVLNLIRVNPDVLRSSWQDSVIDLFPVANQIDNLKIRAGAGQVSIAGLVDDQSSYDFTVEPIRMAVESSGMIFRNQVGIRPQPDSLPASPGDEPEPSQDLHIATVDVSEGAKSDVGQTMGDDQSIQVPVDEDASQIDADITVAVDGTIGKNFAADDSNDLDPDGGQAAAANQTTETPRSDREVTEVLVPESSIVANGAGIQVSDEQTLAPVLVEDSPEPIAAEESDLGNAAEIDADASGPIDSESAIVAVEESPADPQSESDPKDNNPPDNQADRTTTNDNVVSELEMDEKLRSCQDEITALLLDNPVEFDSGSAELGESAIAKLDLFLAAMLNCQDFEFFVAGHTDSRGDEAANVLLSERRALAVRDALVSVGIADSDIRAVGFGSRHPIADNGSSEGRRLNRRIEILVRTRVTR